MRSYFSEKPDGFSEVLQAFNAYGQETSALGMTDLDFIRLLQSAHIPRGSGRERDYLEARKWAGTVAADRGDYERLVTLAAKYVGV